MDFFDLSRILIFLPGVIVGLTVHEFAHAWIADLSGDPTSKNEGRITLNPLKHIDLLGFVFLIAVGFGWAKPVRFNEENLRKKTDVLKIALAGPLSNALLAIVLSVIFVFAAKHPSFNTMTAAEILYYAIFINWGLFIFNLIPLPPLDGSHLLYFPLRRFPQVYEALYKYGSLLLFALLIISSISDVNLLPIANVIKFLTDWFLNLLGY